MGGCCCRRSDRPGNKGGLLDTEDTEKGQDGPGEGDNDEEVGEKVKKEKKSKKGKRKKEEDSSRFLDPLSHTEKVEFLHETYHELVDGHVINMQELLVLLPGYARSEIREWFVKIDPEVTFEDDFSADEADPEAEELMKDASSKEEKKPSKKKPKEQEKKKVKGKEKASEEPEKKKEKEKDKEKAVGKKDGENSKKGGSSKKQPKSKSKAEPAVAMADKNYKPKDDLTLKVKVVSAHDLKDADWAGYSDPFTVVQVFSPEGKQKFKGQTNVIEETLNPVWNRSFPVEFSLGDMLSFKVFDSDTMGSSLLGECVVDHEWFYPLGFEGELLLNEGKTREDHDPHLTVKIDVKKDRTGDGAAVPDDVAILSGAAQGPRLNFEENSSSWKKAHAAVNNDYEDDPDFDPVETTGTALNTIVRLAESGVHIPDSALAKVMRCLQSGDRRYRISALLICRALGKRMIPYHQELLEAFHDKDEGVRAAAIKVFASWNEDANDFVVDIAKMTEDRMHEVRHAALETLGELCQSDCMQALVVIGHTLSSENPQYRLVTVKILLTLGIKATPQAFFLAEMITEDESAEVRAECCKVLANLGLGVNTVQDAIAALYKAEKDYDAGVRKAATEALKRLREEGRDLPRRPRSSGSQDSSHSRTPERGGLGKSPSSREERDRDRTRDRPGSARKGGATRIGRDVDRTREASARRERPASRK